MDSEGTIHIRLAQADDDDFILGLVDRFLEFDLPPWRKRHECVAGIRRDIAHHLSTQPPGTHVFVAENDDADRVGFLHLQTMTDFLTGAQNCHIADVAVVANSEGHGTGTALLDYAERWAREHRCRHLTLSVFPGNTRAIKLYEREGFGTELLRMCKPLR